MEAFDYNTTPAWFIIHTKIGCENLTKDSLEKIVESRHLEDKIFDMFIPVETVSEIKKDKAVEVKKKIFPGYLFINALMTDDIWFIIRNTKNVFGFIGSSGKHAKPTPVTESEVKSLKLRSGILVNNDTFEVGDRVSIVTGAFEGVSGEVTLVLKDSVKINIGNMTIEVEKNNIEKEK